VIFTSTFVRYSFAFSGVPAYAASKSGLIGLTQALAAEFGPQGVRVNAVLPGAVETDMYHAMNGTPEEQTFMTNLHALKRVAKPGGSPPHGPLSGLQRCRLRQRYSLAHRRRRARNTDLSL
jgi:NAD(P)-dependent dehydrogenase (short-subunit alcohol dehydrogenase family)